MEAIRDLLYDLLPNLQQFEARVSGTYAISGPGVLRVMEDRLSMPTPYSGASQLMGPTTSPPAAVQVDGAVDPQEAQCLAHREGKKPKRGEGDWVVPRKAARRHFNHYVLNNMVHRAAHQDQIADRRQAYEIQSGY